jgi:NitT/TauT family transport system permease protein
MTPVLERAALVLSVPLFLLLWHGLSVSGWVNQALFPGPLVVLSALLRQAMSGLLWRDLWASASRVIIGYSIGAATGIIFGVFTGRHRLTGNLLVPVFQMLRPIPPVALVPIVILWFGLSEAGKYFLVVWGVFFAVWMSAHLGVQRVDLHLLRAAASLGARRRAVLLHVVVPAALPTIFVGLRTAIGISFYTLVAAELAGAFAGVAYRVELSHQNMQTAEMMSGLVALGLLSALADKGFGLLARRLVRWN